MTLRHIMTMRPDIFHKSVDLSDPSTQVRFSLIAAGLSVVFSSLILCRGINMNYDAWAFWQGSVSMMHGDGFVHFYKHVPILYWPPLYSVYLLSWQAVLGVSGRVVIVSTIFLAALGSFFWIRLQSVVSSRMVSMFVITLTVVFTAAFVSFYYKTLTSELLRFTILPVYVLFLHRILMRGKGEGVSGAVVGLTVTGTALLLTHHSSLAFVASGFMLLCLQAWRKKDATPLFASILSVGISIASWSVLRSFLGQWNSHPALSGDGFSFLFTNVYMYLVNLGTLLVGPFNGAWLFVVVWFGVFAVFIVRGTKRAGEASSYVAPAEWILIQFALLSIVIHLIISQPARIPTLTRFAWHIALLLVPVIMMKTDQTTHRWLRVTLPLVLVLPIVVRMFGLITATLFDAGGYIADKKKDSWITPATAIHPDLVTGASRSSGDLRFVAPPIYPWLEAEAKRNADE